MNKAAFKKANPHLGKKEIELFDAAYACNEKLIRNLLQQSVSPNIKCVDGYIQDMTPLMVASMGKDAKPECVKALLDAGADAKAKTRSESNGAGDLTPLHFATRTLEDPLPAGTKLVIVLLLAAGAEADAPDNSGDTPLSQVSAAGNLDLVELMFRHVPNQSLKGIRGDSPLLRAAANGNVPMLKYLLDHGADVNAADDQTALMPACRKGQDAIIKLLLEKGADVRIVSSDGDNALTCCAVFARNNCRNENDYAKALELTNLMVSKGAYINQKNNNSMTPLDYALEANDSRVADYLKSIGAKKGSED